MTAPDLTAALGLSTIAALFLTTLVTRCNARVGHADYED